VRAGRFSLALGRVAHGLGNTYGMDPACFPNVLRQACEKKVLPKPFFLPYFTGNNLAVHFSFFFGVVEDIDHADLRRLQVRDSGPFAVLCGLPAGAQGRNLA